jgi:hypothetical protein
MTRKTLIGFQLADRTGVNIAGDDSDPSHFHSFEVIHPEDAATAASRWPGHLLMPIYEGDIEEPVIVRVGPGESKWATLTLTYEITDEERLYRAALEAVSGLEAPPDLTKIDGKTMSPAACIMELLVDPPGTALEAASWKDDEE